MLRVMLLVTDLQPGGTPLRIVRIARTLPEFGVQPIVGCLATRGSLAAVLEDTGTETFACDARDGRDIACLAELARQIRRFDPDLLHSTLFHANLAARLVGRLDRIRPVITGSATIEVRRGWHRLLEALTLGQSDVHVVNSGAVADHVANDLGLPRSRIVVVRNPIDLDAIDRAQPIDRAAHQIPSDRPLIVWAGRFDPDKRLDRLLDVLDALAVRAHFTAVLIGDGSLRDWLHARIPRSPAASSIRLLGWQRDLIPWLKAADLVTLTSRTEGSPNIVLEALACGCCVIADAIPACVELLHASRAGCLVRSDRVEDFAEKAAALLDKTDQRDLLIRESRRVVRERHDLRMVVGQLSELYRSVAADVMGVRA